MRRQLIWSGLDAWRAEAAINAGGVVLEGVEEHLDVRGRATSVVEAAQAALLPQLDVRSVGDRLVDRLRIEFCS